MRNAVANYSITFRSVTADDADFLLELYKSSRGDDLRKLGWEDERIDEFLGMQYEAQQRFYESEYRRVADQVVLADDKPAGRLMFEQREHEIRCVDFALLPQYRGQGIGTGLLKNLQSQARGANKPLRLQVIRFNRAINLFERVGFVRTSETGTHFQMEWRA
jgi:GNAT superfamily N-acetyltransferase